MAKHDMCTIQGMSHTAQTHRQTHKQAVMLHMHTPTACYICTHLLHVLSVSGTLSAPSNDDLIPMPAHLRRETRVPLPLPSDQPLHIPRKPLVRDHVE